MWGSILLLQLQALRAERHLAGQAGLGGGRQLAAVGGGDARLRVRLLPRQPGAWSSDIPHAII